MKCKPLGETFIPTFARPVINPNSSSTIDFIICPKSYLEENRIIKAQVVQPPQDPVDIDESLITEANQKKDFLPTTSHKTVVAHLTVPILKTYFREYKPTQETIRKPNQPKTLEQTEQVSKEIEKRIIEDPLLQIFLTSDNERDIENQITSDFLRSRQHHKRITNARNRAEQLLDQELSNDNLANILNIRYEKIHTEVLTEICGLKKEIKPSYKTFYNYPTVYLMKRIKNAANRLANALQKRKQPYEFPSLRTPTTTN